MDMLIIIGITAFFGMVALSMIAGGNAPSPAQVIVLRADQLKERDSDQSSGLGIFVLIAVIAGAIWLL